MAGLVAPTLDEAARNPNGTYDGAKALSWISEVLHLGAGVPIDEVKQMWDQTRAIKVNEGFGVPGLDASAPGVQVELEPQARGGALLRQHAPPADDEAEERTMDSRRAERMALVPAIYKTMHERMACELAMAPAMAESEADVFARYNYDPEAAARLMEFPLFVSLLARIKKEVQEQGLTFKAKARLIAEELLPTVFDMSTDPLISSAVRLDGAKWVSKMAGLEPKEKELAGGGGGLNLSITFAGQAPVQVVSHQPALIEQERG